MNCLFVICLDVVAVLLMNVVVLFCICVGFSLARPCMVSIVFGLVLHSDVRHLVMCLVLVVAQHCVLMLVACLGVGA